jgi:hypothetical protein
MTQRLPCVQKHHLLYDDFVGVVTPSCFVSECIYRHTEHNLQNTTHSFVISFMFRPLLAAIRWIVFAVTINTVQYRDCAISKCSSSRCIWDWYCLLTSVVIKQVPASYLAHTFYFSFPHFFIPQVPVCLELGSVISASHGVGYGRLGSEHRWRCN